MRALRSILFLVPMGVVMGTGFFACVGDDPGATNEGGTPVGDYGGKCFEDGKCKEGLVCVDGLICVRPGESADSGTAGDASSPDATSSEDAASEAGAECGAPALPMNTSHVPCLKEGYPSTCVADFPVCCVGSDGIACVADAPGCTSAGNIPWSCSSTAHCPPSSVCCVKGGLVPAINDACGINQDLQTRGGSECATACAADMVQLCNEPGTTGGCLQGKRCKRLLTKFRDIEVIIGACAP